MARYTLTLALLLAGSAYLSAAPRVLPKEQASRFCQLLIFDGESKVYPLTIYAQHLVTTLCGQLSYNDYTAEQVFTGLIFYYEDWILEPFILNADADNQQLVYELHSGLTLRMFPYKDHNAIKWFAPTERIPDSVDAEHRRYMQEVFTRLNAEVASDNWETVDAYISRMIQYQCQFGGDNQSSPFSSGLVIALWSLISVCIVFFASMHVCKYAKRTGKF